MRLQHSQDATWNFGSDIEAAIQETQARGEISSTQSDGRAFFLPTKFLCCRTFKVSATPSPSKKTRHVKIVSKSIIEMLHPFMRLFFSSPVPSFGSQTHRTSPLVHLSISCGHLNYFLCRHLFAPSRSYSLSLLRLQIPPPLRPHPCTCTPVSLSGDIKVHGRGIDHGVLPWRLSHERLLDETCVA